MENANDEISGERKVETFFDEQENKIIELIQEAGTKVGVEFIAFNSEASVDAVAFKWGKGTTDEQRQEFEDEANRMIANEFPYNLKVRIEQHGANGERDRSDCYDLFSQSQNIPATTESQISFFTQEPELSNLRQGYKRDREPDDDQPILSKTTKRQAGATGERVSVFETVERNKMPNGGGDEKENENTNVTSNEQQASDEKENENTNVTSNEQHANTGKQQALPSALEKWVDKVVKSFTGEGVVGAQKFGNPVLGSLSFVVGDWEPNAVTRALGCEISLLDALEAYNQSAKEGTTKILQIVGTEVVSLQCKTLLIYLPEEKHCVAWKHNSGDSLGSLYSFNAIYCMNCLAATNLFPPQTVFLAIEDGPISQLEQDVKAKLKDMTASGQGN